MVKFKKPVALVSMLAMMLATAAPAFADSVGTSITLKAQNKQECVENELAEACADVQTDERSVSAQL